MATLLFDKAIFARTISGRLFGGGKEDGAEAASVYPLPAIETRAELCSRLALAEERLAGLKAMLEDMQHDRDAWREQAQTRRLAPPASPSWWRWPRKTA